MGWDRGCGDEYGYEIRWGGMVRHKRPSDLDNRLNEFIGDIPFITLPPAKDAVSVGGVG